MAKDDYELLPHAELEFLRKEVERLKKNPLGDTQASVSLLDSMNELNLNMSHLIQIFQSANDDMSRMARDGSIAEQMQRLRDENAKIAHGIVALSSMLKDSPSMPGPIAPQVPIPEPGPAEGPSHDEVVQQLKNEPNPFAEPTPPPPVSPAQTPAEQQATLEDIEDAPVPDEKDQITGEPLPPPPRR